LHNEVLTGHLMLLDVKIEETEPIRACSTHGKGVNCTHSFNGEF